MSGVWHKLQQLWSERSNKLWVLPTVNSVLAVVLALAAAWIPPLMPGVELPVIEAKTLDNLLSVIASSMLAVTTFSLSIMVSAFASASSGVTPRATELVMGDEGTRSAIANFLSAFMFSIVAQVALGLKYYGSNGRFILFVATCVVLAWLMLTLLRWVRTLSSLGRLGNTLERVERHALATLQAYWRQPCLGTQVGAPRSAADTVRPGADGTLQPPPGVVCAQALLLVRRLHLAQLHTLAETHACRLHLRVRPGDRVTPGQVLATIAPDDPAQPPTGAALQALEAGIRQGVVLHAGRTFDQDPRFGLIVLCEAGQRALSAAINDPGTAISCMEALARVLVHSQQPPDGADDTPTAALPHYDRLTLVPLDPQDFVQDAFGPLLRDGAPFYELGVRLQKLLAAVALHSPDTAVADSARAHAALALACAQERLPYAPDRAALAQLHERLFAPQ